MKRGWLSLGLAVMTLGAVGCVAATVKDNRFGTSRDVVSVNGQVYVVDTATGKVMKLDVTDAGPFVPAEESD